MIITIAGTTFDHHHYDERGNVLYLDVGEPRPDTEPSQPTRRRITLPASSPSPVGPVR